MIYKGEIENSLKILENKKLLLYPTDTVWGIGCDATDEEAIIKIYKLKNREESKSLIILVSSFEMLKKYVSIPLKATEIIKRATKPTTIIYKNPKNIANNAISIEDNTVAIRIVQDDFCKGLIEAFEKPIISTSANISGQPTPKSFLKITKPILEGVDYIVNLHQERETTKSSTILKIVDDSIVVLRE